MSDRLLAFLTIFIFAVAAVAVAIAAWRPAPEIPPLDLPAGAAPAPAVAEDGAILRLAVVGYAPFGTEEAILGAVDLPVRPDVPFEAKIDFGRPLPPEFGTQAVTGTIRGRWYGTHEDLALVSIAPRLSWSVTGPGWSHTYTPMGGVPYARPVLRPGIPIVLPSLDTPFVAAVLLTPEEAKARPAGERSAWIDLAERGAGLPALPDRKAVRAAARELGRDDDILVDGGPFVGALLAGFAFGDEALVSDLRKRAGADESLFPGIARAYGANPATARDMQLAARLLGPEAVRVLTEPPFEPPVGPIGLGNRTDFPAEANRWLGMPPLRVLRFTTEPEEIGWVERMLEPKLTRWSHDVSRASLAHQDPLTIRSGPLPLFLLEHDPPTEAAAPLWRTSRERVVDALPPGVGMPFRRPTAFAVALLLAALAATGVALLPAGRRDRRLRWLYFVAFAGGAACLGIVLPGPIGRIVLCLAGWHLAIVWMRSAAPHPPWERLAVAAALFSLTVFALLGVSAASIHPALGPASLAGFFLVWPLAARASGRREGDPGTGALRIFLFLAAALSLALLPGFREAVVTPALFAATGFALVLTLVIPTFHVIRRRRRGA